MVILGIESSAPSASAAIIKDGKVLSSMYLNVGLTHSVTLMPMIKQAVESAGLTPDDINAVAVSVGPGSFTGVRIGVATAKGIAQKNNTDCIAVSTLEAIAYPLIDSECIAVSVMDARCSQVYTASFDCSDGKMSRITADSAISLEELTQNLQNANKKVVLIGDGADISYDYMCGKVNNLFKASPIMKYQNAASVALIAEKSEAHTTPDKLVPSYLRPPQAVRELKKKQNT